MDNIQIPNKDLQILNEAYARSRKDQSIMWKNLMIYSVEKSVYDYQKAKEREAETENAIESLENLDLCGFKKRKNSSSSELTSKRRRSI